MNYNPEADNAAQQLIADIKTEFGIQEYGGARIAEKRFPLPACGWVTFGRNYNTTVDDTNFRHNYGVDEYNTQNTSSVNLDRGVTAQTHHHTDAGIYVGYRLSQNGIVHIVRSGTEPTTGERVDYSTDLASPGAAALVVKLAGARIRRNARPKSDENLFADIENGWFVPDMNAQELQPEFEHAFRAIKDTFRFAKSSENDVRLVSHTQPDELEIVLRADSYPGPGVITPVGHTVLNLRANGDWKLVYSEQTSHSIGKRANSISFHDGVVTTTRSGMNSWGRRNEYNEVLSSTHEADLPQLAGHLKHVGDALDNFVYLRSLSYPERVKAMKQQPMVYRGSYGI